MYLRISFFDPKVNKVFLLFLLTELQSDGIMNPTYDGFEGENAKETKMS